MAEELVCYCKLVTKERILQAIRQGHYTVEAIGELTQAGTGCGSCQLEIQRLIDFMRDTQKDLPPPAPFPKSRWEKE